MFDEIPISIIELQVGRFRTLRDMSLPDKLTRKSRRSQNKAIIRGAKPGIPHELQCKIH